MNRGNLRKEVLIRAYFEPRAAVGPREAGADPPQDAGRSSPCAGPSTMGERPQYCPVAPLARQPRTG